MNTRSAGYVEGYTDGYDNGYAAGRKAERESRDEDKRGHMTNAESWNYEGLGGYGSQER